VKNEHLAVFVGLISRHHCHGTAIRQGQTAHRLRVI